MRSSFSRNRGPVPKGIARRHSNKCPPAKMAARRSCAGPLANSPDELRSEQFGPILKVHGIEVPPLAAPNEAVLLEDFHDLGRDAVAIAALRAPQPVIGKFRIDIDRGAPGMHAAVARVFDGSAGERAGARKGECL